MINRKFITADMKMADIILRNEKLVLVIRRFGINLGFRNKTIEELSKEYDIHLDLLLLVVNLFNDDSLRYASVNDVTMIPGLIDYLKAGHRYYVHEKLPYIQSLIGKFVEESKNSKSSMLLDFFNEYRDEVIEHINYEDTEVYPYIGALYDKHRNQEYNNDFTIKEYTEHHSDIEEKLTELKLLLIKYFPHTENGNFYRDLILQELFDLEYDLNDHANLEDDILVSLVKKVEEAYETQ